MGHPKTTMFRRMIPILSGHEVCQGDANKVGVYNACVKYFMVLVDAAGIHFEVSLLSTRNIVFAKLLGMLIKFRTHHPEFPVRTLRMDNAQEFRSQHFENYCRSKTVDDPYIPCEEEEEEFSNKNQYLAAVGVFWIHSGTHLQKGD